MKRKQPQAKTKRRDVELSFPPPEEWENIIHDCKLTPAQASALKFTLCEGLDDISRYRVKLQSRALLVDRLKKLEKALNHLQHECRRSAELMQNFLPIDTLVYIGQSLTISAMREMLGRSVFPKKQDKHARRETLGLKYGHLILTRFIERIHAPLARWIELDRLNKGGRPADAVRRHLIYCLAEAAPEIIGKPATVAITGKFADLCTAVLQACGLPEAGIAKAISPVVRKLRADRAKRRIGYTP
jgi:hypothetical protein